MNTPIIPERRKPLTRKQRANAHSLHGGICCVCRYPIGENEPFIDEHVIPLELGGSNDHSNRGIAHIQCAKHKTERDRKMIDKAARQRAKYLGIKKTRKGPPIMGSKASGWKKKLDGSVVRR